MSMSVCIILDNIYQSWIDSLLLGFSFRFQLSHEASHGPIYHQNLPPQHQSSW